MIVNVVLSPNAALGESAVSVTLKPPATLVVRVVVGVTVDVGATAPFATGVGDTIAASDGVSAGVETRTWVGVDGGGGDSSSVSPGTARKSGRQWAGWVSPLRVVQRSHPLCHSGRAPA